MEPTSSHPPDPSLVIGSGLQSSRMKCIVIWSRKDGNPTSAKINREVNIYRQKYRVFVWFELTEHQVQDCHDLYMY